MPLTIEETDVKIDELIDELLDKPFKLILYNDDVNTFDWVILCLVKVCKMSSIQAEQASLMVHYKGKCTVKEGSHKKLQPFKDALIERGLSATIEGE